MSRFLLDANVVIALTVLEHEHHEAAAAWFQTIDAFALCPIVEGALVRFLVRVGESYATASEVLARLHAHDRCEFWPDSLSYADVDGRAVRGHRQVTDTYLAALAARSSGVLATFDEALAAQHPQCSRLISRVR